MTEPLLYRPTEDEKLAFNLSWAKTWNDTAYEDGAMRLAYDQAQRTGKTAFACYLAIFRSL